MVIVDDQMIRWLRLGYLVGPVSSRAPEMRKGIYPFQTPSDVTIGGYCSATRLQHSTFPHLICAVLSHIYLSYSLEEVLAEDPICLVPVTQSSVPCLQGL